VGVGAGKGATDGSRGHSSSAGDDGDTASTAAVAVGPPAQVTLRPYVAPI